MKVFVSHSGDSFELEALQGDCDALIELRKVIEDRCGIGIEDQILLLETGQQLALPTTKSEFKEAYVLLDEKDILECEVYAFDKRIVTLKRAYISQSVGNPSVVLPERHTVLRSPQIPTQISSLLLSHLADYEQTFHWGLEKAKTFASVSQNRIQIAHDLLQRSKVQISSIYAVVQNVGRHSEILSETISQLSTNFSTQQQKFTETTATLGDQLKNLALTPLHPVLQVSGTRETLLDCVSETEIRKWVTKCSERFLLLSSHLDDIASTKEHINETIHKQLFHSKTSMLIEHCDSNVIGSLEKVLWNQLQVVQLFQTHHSQSEDALEQLIVALQSSTDLNDCRESLNLLLNTHADLFSQLEHENRKGEALLSGLIEQSHRLATFYFKVMRQVSELQLTIKHSHDRIYVCKRTLDKLSTSDLHPFTTVHKMEEAYSNALHEIRRRKQFLALFNLKAGKVASVMGALRTTEIARRSWFMREYGRYLPKELVDLGQRPPVCDIQIRSFDEDLPDLGGSDVQSQCTEESFDDVGTLVKENALLRMDNETLREKVEGSRSMQSSERSVRGSQGLNELEEKIVSLETQLENVELRESEALKQVHLFEAEIAELKMQLKSTCAERDTIALNWEYQLKQNDDLRDTLGKVPLFKDLQKGNVAVFYRDGDDDLQALSVGPSIYKVPTDQLLLKQAPFLGRIQEISQTSPQKYFVSVKVVPISDYPIL